MKVNRLVVGLLETNCYILSINDECMVIDPGDEFDRIKKVIGDKKIVGVIVTHSHFDHIGALNKFDNKLIFKMSNLQERNYTIGNFNFDIIYTRGHKEDSITIYFKEDNIMFTGDFIFKNSIGRVDLPGGNINDMIESLNKISNYNKDIIVYPGHGEFTKLGKELLNNGLFLK